MKKPTLAAGFAAPATQPYTPAEKEEARRHYLPQIIAGPIRQQIDLLLEAVDNNTQPTRLQFQLLQILLQFDELTPNRTPELHALAQRYNISTAATPEEETTPSNVLAFG